MPEGLLLVNKPTGVTSHDVVDVVRRHLGTRRIGHTGTLDPMAQGLLILLIGSATKRQQALQGHDKTYEAVLQLGAQTETGDAQGRVIRTAAVPPLDRPHVEAVLSSLLGPMEQTPPAYSAVKVRGRPAYWWARRHQVVTLPARTVHIRAINLLEIGQETIAFRVSCSSGTYIRTLAETIAQRLGTVGHLIRLTRHRIGPWCLDDATPLAWIRQASVAEMMGKVHPLAP